jgi:hypothetical protein
MLQADCTSYRWDSKEGGVPSSINWVMHGMVYTILRKLKLHIISCKISYMNLCYENIYHERIFFICSTYESLPFYEQRSKTFDLILYM